MAFYGRGKNRIQNPKNLMDFYKDYIEEFKDDYIDGKQYWQICDEFYRGIVDGILNGESFKMPFKLGCIEINKSKELLDRIRHKKNIDWGTFNKTGKKIIHLNEHTNGYNYKILWKPSGRLKYRQGYYFIAARDFKRTLAKLIKNKEQDYYELEH